MNACVRSVFVCLLLCLAAPAAFAQGLDYRPSVARAANLDGGELTQDEWNAFLADLPVAEDGSISRPYVLARVFVAYWDRDADGKTTWDDMSALYKELDADQSGGVKSTEISQFARADRNSWRGMMSAAVLTDYLLQAAGESVGEDGIPSTLWDQLAMAVGDDGVLKPELVYEWLAILQAIPPSDDPNAITSGVYIASVDSALDTDFNGRLSLSDLEALFSGLDTDGNGSIDAAEMRGRVGSGSVGTRRPRTPSADEPRDEPVAPAEPLIPWQRSLEDALALSKQYQKPLLVCVNVQEESASDILRRFKYRDADFAAKAAGFIPVIVAPVPRGQREYDDRGRRVADEQFGRVVESESVNIEPLVKELYFGTQQVAPRHIGVSPDGEILFDIYLVNDLSIIDRNLEKHGNYETSIPDPATATETELFDSRDAGHRDHLESLFVEGNERTRVRLASLCLSSVRETQHPELLRMALLDESESVRCQAVWTAVQHPHMVPTELLLDVFSVAETDEGQLSAVVAAVRRMRGADEPHALRAGRLDRIFTGLQSDSAVLDVERWKLALAFAPATEELEPSPDQTAAVGRRLAQLEGRLADSPDDRELNLLFADTLMRLARIQMMNGGNPTYLLDDVRRAAVLATSPEEPNGRALGFLAWSSYLLSEMEAAVDYAAQALPHLRADAASPLAAQTLQVFARGRLNALYAEMSGADSWPREWIADIRDVYEVLIAHPAVTETQVMDYIGFLDTIEAHRIEERVVRRGIELFPSSTQLHASLRRQVLRDHGARGLIEVYDDLDTPPDEAASFSWYAGLAILMAAERQVQNRQIGEALVAYDRSVERFRESFSQQPRFRRSATHYMALALAGAAQLHMDAERWEDAVVKIREGLETSPGSASTKDGLGNTPEGVARAIQRALVRQGKAEEASALRDTIRTATGS